MTHTIKDAPNGPAFIGPDGLLYWQPARDLTSSEYAEVRRLGFQWRGHVQAWVAPSTKATRRALLRYTARIEPGQPQFAARPAVPAPAGICDGCATTQNLTVIADLTLCPTCAAHFAQWHEAEQQFLHEAAATSRAWFFTSLLLPGTPGLADALSEAAVKFESCTQVIHQSK